MTSADPDAAWKDFHQRWQSLRPPLRPPPSVAEAIDAEIGARTGRVLLLGVTPELAAIDRPMLAMDWNAAIIRLAWPGNGPHRQVVQADWKTLPIADSSIEAVIGDGSLSMLRWPEGQRVLLGHLRRVMRPGGVIAIRCFARPDPWERPEAVLRQALAGQIDGFHAMKLRLNMALAEPDHMITSDESWRMFEAMIPDRARLVDATGWSLGVIAEIDAYRGSHYIHAYPPRAALHALMDEAGFDARFVETGDYPASEFCPILVARAR